MKGNMLLSVILIDFKKYIVIIPKIIGIQWILLVFDKVHTSILQFDCEFNSEYDNKLMLTGVRQNSLDLDEVGQRQCFNGC